MSLCSTGFRLLPLLLATALTGTSFSSHGQNVIAWGDNSAGQCNVPGSVTNAVAIAAGATFSLALNGDGTITSWGSAPSVPADLTNVLSIVAGSAHCAALRADGTVTAWGNNAQGQTAVPPSATNAVSLAAGYNHTLALRGDGREIGRE